MTEIPVPTATAPAPYSASCATCSSGCPETSAIKPRPRFARRGVWTPKEGAARLEKLAEWYERDWPQAAASLREGVEECFTINRLGLPLSLHRCLATTNIVESPHAGVRERTRRVTRWRDAQMVKRWAAAGFLDAEKSSAS